MNIIKYLHPAFLVLISTSSFSMEKPAQTDQLTSGGKFLQAINDDREEIIDCMLRTKEIDHLGITYKIKVDGRETEMPPLSYAIVHGKLKVAGKLLQYSPREHVRSTDSQGESPLGWALCAGHAQIIPELISAGAEIDPCYVAYVNRYTKFSEDEKKYVVQLLENAYRVQTAREQFLTDVLKKLKQPTGKNHQD